MSIIDNFCSLRIQVNNFDKIRKNQLSRFFLWCHFQNCRHITLFQNRDFIYKYKLHVWPIFYTIFRDKDYDYAIKIWVEGHQTSLNVISRSQYHIKSRILILKLIGPLNTYTLVPWAPLNWKKCSLVRSCAMCPLTCLLWYSADIYSQNSCGFFARGHSRSLGVIHRLCYIRMPIHLPGVHLRQTLTT